MALSTGVAYLGSGFRTRLGVGNQGGREAKLTRLSKVKVTTFVVLGYSVVLILV